ncbi:alkaline phosphatase family protein [Myxococcota bacterium]|nr:alkaline phosphatase family protein [Myxococcota bacterium]
MISTSRAGVGALGIFLAWALWAWGPVGANPSLDAPTVVLISLDGTRPEDLNEQALPSLVSLGQRGAVAQAMIPAIPTNTFPNHVTLATGVAPEKHGLVNNLFEDPKRGLFRKQDIPSWIEVEPIWSIAERHGVVSAAYYWVGSEGSWPGGRAPTHWKVFSGRTSEAKKVDQILDWLDLDDPKRRPRLIMSWFRGGDHAGHDHGPGSREVIEALRIQDKEIARLIDGFDERGLFSTTTLIFVSDHGMAAPKGRVDLGRALQRSGIDARVLGIGGFATVVPGSRDRDDPERIRRIAEVARALGLDAFAREDAPPDAGVDHPRFGAVIVRADRDVAIVHEGLELKGFHGYDPRDPAMAALLVAAGRGVAPGTTLAPLRSIQVAPTVLQLLGVPRPAWMEGRPIPEFTDSL